VELAQDTRGGAAGVQGVHAAIERKTGEAIGARPATEPSGLFEDGDVRAAAGEGGGAGQTGEAPPDHDGANGKGCVGCHRRLDGIAAARVTVGPNGVARTSCEGLRRGWNSCTYVP